MIAFGLFMLLAVGIIGGFTVAAGNDPAVVNLLGFDLETTERWQFATGALCALGAVVALRIIAIGWRRSRRRRRELRELRETVSTSTSDRRHDRDDQTVQSDRDDWDERDHFDSTPHD
ncbi:MAG TPA: hypothetical protein VEX15_04285 [Nocardioidaceae bacterium]|nr:hypothetical protein [Nocardioidaceae bacterium]